MSPLDELTSIELESMDDFLSRIDGGKIPNTEALDGFFAALACCPDLIPPSEYLPVIQGGEVAADNLIFENIEEAERFMTLVSKHWNYVNAQLNEDVAYIPLVMEDEYGKVRGNDWANGFLCGTSLRYDIWSEIVNDEEHGGAMVPIWALAYENHPDPKMRPFKEPIDDQKREDLIIAAAAGVMGMHEYFYEQRDQYLSETKTFTRPHRKVGRNDPCPCGSGKKYKKCCGGGSTIH